MYYIQILTALHGIYVNNTFKERRCMDLDQSHLKHLNKQGKAYFIYGSNLSPAAPLPALGLYHPSH
jgi:hypothetical protein